jgi:hypothetical protein
MAEADGDSDGMPENDLWYMNSNFYMVFLNTYIIYFFLIFIIFLAFTILI